MEKNEREFLENYNSDLYEKPSVAVDIVLLTIEDEEEENYRKIPEKVLKVLLLKRDEYPFKDKWALPGGFAEKECTLEETAEKKLREKVGVDNIYMEQLYTWSKPDRDPRTRVLSVSYIALVDKSGIQAVPGKSASEVKWVPVRNIRNYELAFDHREIVEYAKERIKNKIEYTDIAFNLMPEYFTLTELQKVYEVILDQPLLTANFRRKIKDKVIETDKEKTGSGHRKAKLFVRRGQKINHRATGNTEKSFEKIRSTTTNR